MASSEHALGAQDRKTAKPYVSLLRSFCMRLCVSVTLGVILLAAVEVFSYARYRNYGTNDVLEAGARMDLAANGDARAREYWKQFQQSNKVLYHQYVLWRRAPYEGELIGISKEGVRRTLHTRCDGRTFTIWMFGDSVTWGDGASDGETIPSLVAAHYEKAGQPVCMVNYGEKGWSNTQEMLSLIEELKHTSRKPDIVLFYDGGTEAFAAYQSGRADVHSNFEMFRGFLDTWGAKQRASFDYLEETNTYRLLHRIAAKSLFHSIEQTPRHIDVENLSAAVIQNYQQNMEIIDLLAKQYSFRAIFAWYPNLAVGHKELTSYEQQVLQVQYRQFPGLGQMYQAVYRRSVQFHRPEYFDLEHIVDDRKDSIYVGISHMKPEGDQIVAERLFEILEKNDSRR